MKFKTILFVFIIYILWSSLCQMRIKSETSDNKSNQRQAQYKPNRRRSFFHSWVQEEKQLLESIIIAADINES